MPELYEQNEYNTGEYVDSKEHVPTTIAVRASYATDYYMVEVGSLGTADGRAAAFDRWLAQHDREVASEALLDAAHYFENVDRPHTREALMLKQRAAEILGTDTQP